MLTHIVLLSLLLQSRGAPVPRPPAPPPRLAPAASPTFFTSPYSLAEMTGKQAVVATSAGSFVVQLLPESAPNHVGFFMSQAREGAYAGTTFHRVIRYGMIQGGDPISKDPGKTLEYGSGGFNRLRAESRTERATAGAVAAVLLNGQPDSAGLQFFICATDQPGIEGQYTIFGRVVDGLEVVQQISAAEANADGRPRARIDITSVTVRDTPPVPFINDSAAQLAAYRTIVETSMGNVELEMLPDKAPETVRAFLRMAAAGVYDGIGVHRVAANFVIQTGALAFRSTPLLARQQSLVGNLRPEFTNTPNVPGIVSMARGAEPDSGSTSFFICIGECRALDNQYAVFARVVSGMDVVSAMAAVPVNGEAPVTPITMTRVRVERK